MLKEKTTEQMRIRLREIRKELERVKGSIYSLRSTIKTIIGAGHWLSEYLDVARYVAEIRDLQVEAVGLLDEQHRLTTELYNEGEETSYELEEMSFQLNCAREHLQETLELAAA
jgi:hypothetical protein